MAVNFFSKQSPESLQSQSLELVTIVIVINVGRFSGVDLKWLAQVAVRLQVSDYTQLSDYNFAN